jgi:hypothetical protein
MTTVNLHAEFDLDEIAQQVAPYISPSVIAQEIDLYEVAANVDTDQIAYVVAENLDISAYDVAEEFSVQDIAQKINLEALAEYMAEMNLNQSEDLIQPVPQELMQRIEVLERRAKAMTDILRGVQQLLTAHTNTVPSSGWVITEMNPNDPANRNPF